MTEQLQYGSATVGIAFFKPADGWLADVIPFYWEGRFHLFYLKDYRDEIAHGEGTPWFHVSTTDFVSFADHGEALSRGSPDEQDLYVFTGSVIERGGLFHIFYTGHNGHFPDEGKPTEAVMHATSADLIQWSKDPGNPILFADAGRYEVNDWRDPFVIWNDEANEYWMLLAARLKVGPENRRGCVALAASRDLEHWSIRDPFWAPGLYFTHEVPDLFRVGAEWYLVYSTFSERMVTHYRTARRLAGPWTAPVDDTFDGRAFYAAKTASDGTRRFAFGWLPSRVGETDAGAWQWGGHLVVHELETSAEGGVQVRPPAEVVALYANQIQLDPTPVRGVWDHAGDSFSAIGPDSFSYVGLARMPSSCMVETVVTIAPNTRGVGIILRADDSLEHYYQVRIEPGRQRVAFDRWPRPGDEPFMIERPLAVGDPTVPFSLRILVEGSAIVTYVNDRVALSARGYDHSNGAVGLFVSEGAATFKDVKVLAPG